MKLNKLFLYVMLIFTLFMISCSSDNNPVETEKNDEPPKITYKEIKIPSVVADSAQTGNRGAQTYNNMVSMVNNYFSTFKTLMAVKKDLKKNTAAAEDGSWTWMANGHTWKIDYTHNFNTDLWELYFDNKLFADFLDKIEYSGDIVQTGNLYDLGGLGNIYVHSVTDTEGNSNIEFSFNSTIKGTLSLNKDNSSDAHYEIGGVIWDMQVSKNGHGHYTIKLLNGEIISDSW